MSAVTRRQDAEGKASNQNTRQRSSATSQSTYQRSSANQSTQQRSSANQSTRQRSAKQSTQQASTPSLSKSEETGSKPIAPSEEVKGHPVSKDEVKLSEPALPIIEVVFYIVCIVGIMFKANILSVYRKSNGMFVIFFFFNLIFFFLCLFVCLFVCFLCSAISLDLVHNYHFKERK